ncbi:MAG: TolC family protein [Acidobacteria bacterium]|nr:TolC family protein [Acidobacteriota bacterium]
MGKKLTLLILLILIAKNTQAQTPDKSTLLQSQAKERIGVNSQNSIQLTIEEAVRLALENNRDIEVERINIKRSEFDLAATQGIFDPTLDLRFSYNHRNSPVTSLLAGGENGKLESSGLNTTATFFKRLPWQGSDLKVTLESNRLTSDNLFNSLNPEYRTGLVLDFTQPLLRNRKIDSERHKIKISSKKLALSDIEFRKRVIEIITQVRNSYWDLVFSYRNEEIKREAVELAQTQLEQNQRLVDKGTLAPSDVISTRVEIERRIDEAEAALEAVQRAENNLKALILQPSQSTLWNAMFLPVEQPVVNSSELIELKDALKIAFQNRPEMEQYKVKADLNKIDIEYFQNQIKPEVNFIASYGSTGLAGSKRTTLDPITTANQPLFNRINQLSQLAGLPLITSSFNNSVESRFIGGYKESLKNLFENKFNSWQVGININFALGNRTAKAQLGQAFAQERQISVEQERTQQAIEVEVRNVLQSVSTAYRRVEAASNSYTNAELQYQAEQRKFEAGLSTNFLILDRQNALSLARGRKLKALTDYNKAITDLERTLSTTLSNKNIVINQ